MKVSFLLPVASPAPYLGATLASLIEQDYDSWELVLVVDGSAPEIVQQARAHIPDNLLTLVELTERRGIAAALNTGLQHARGELIARIDSDDLCRFDRLRLQVSTMDSRPDLALLGSGARLVDGTGSVIGERKVVAGTGLKPSLLNRNQFVHSSVIFRTHAIRSLGGYSESCHLREDYELWLRVARYSAIDNCDEALVDYRITPTQLSRGVPTREALSLVAAAQRDLATAIGRHPFKAAIMRWAWRSAQHRLIQKIRSSIMRSSRGGGAVESSRMDSP